MARYDLLLQNNASRKTYAITGLTDSGSWMNYLFENFSMPEDAQEGEYTAFLFYNGRRDVEYQFSPVLGDTIARTGEGDIKISKLRPEIFLLKYGKITDTNTYYKGENKVYEYKKK